MSHQWPTATRSDHQRFCETEGWDQVRTARGTTGTHHVTYELGLPDGRRLRTRISHPVDRTDYGPRMWKHILRDQLEVDEPTFWACVKNGDMPDRGGSTPGPGEAIPAALVAALLNTVHISESEVAAMTKEQAVARLNEFWTNGS